MRKPDSTDRLAVYVARNCATPFQVECVARTVMECSRKAAMAAVRDGFLKHADVDDVCQDVWVKAFGRMKTYDPHKAAFGTWVGVITRSVVGDYRRKYGKNNVLVPLEDDANVD